VILFRSTLLLALLLFSGCDKPPSDGPTEIRWDRQSCEQCSMLISDRHFAGQYLDAKGKYHLFDDPGEMALSFMEKTASDEKAKLYVTDFKSGEWLKAREAHFTEGHLTPMGYGYGASKEPQEGSMDFNTLLKRLSDGEKGAPTPSSSPTTQTDSHTQSGSHADSHRQH
jgi:copper chaperone NosL